MNKNNEVIIEQDYETFKEIESKRLNDAAEAEGRTLKEATVTKRVARNFLKGVLAVESNLDLIPELKEAFKIMFGGRSNSGGGVSTAKSVIRNVIKGLLAEEGSISEQDVFTKSIELGSAWGRAEMRKFIKDSINTAPEDRMWVAFQAGTDSPMGAYVLEGRGPDAPEEWAGYVPAEVAIDL